MGSKHVLKKISRVQPPDIHTTSPFWVPNNSETSVHLKPRLGRDKHPPHGAEYLVERQARKMIVSRLLSYILTPSCAIYLLHEHAREERRISEDLQPMDTASASGFMAQHGCSAQWTSWPSLQAEGAEDNTFLVFKLYHAVGNLFITLSGLIRVRAMRASLPTSVTTKKQ